MLHELFFFETVHAAAVGLKPVEEVRSTGDVHRVEITVTDFLPAERDDEPRVPWHMQVVQKCNASHPFFGRPCAHTEIALPLWTIQPHTPGYLDLVAASAAPCLDHQRFLFHARATWDPDTGQMAVYSQLRHGEDSLSTQVDRLVEHLRDVIALTYLISFRMWQLRLRTRVPVPVSEPVVEKLHRQMLALLDAAPPDAPR